MMIPNPKVLLKLNEDSCCKTILPGLLTPLKPSEKTKTLGIRTGTFGGGVTGPRVSGSWRSYTNAKTKGWEALKKKYMIGRDLEELFQL